MLNRRLSPIWNLDPNGFAGYLFLKNQVLEDAIRDPMSTVKYFDKKYSKIEESNQLTLFDIQLSDESEKEDDFDEESEN